MKKKNENRHLELSTKFMEMGQALVLEGQEKQDYVIIQSGTFFILMAGIIFSEDDVFMFSELCGMFSAKKVLESMGGTKQIANQLKKGAKNDSYDDFIKKINKLRDSFGHGPIE